MRWLYLAVLGALVWTLYWGVAAWGLRHGVETWFQSRQSEGWLAEYADIGTAGFPARHVTRLEAVALADPETGVAWQADALHLESPAIWPGDLTLKFPATPMPLSHFDATLVLQGQDATARLRLAPGLALELQDLVLAAGSWSVSRDDLALAKADGADVAMRQTATPERYDIRASLPGFAPGLPARGAMGIPPELPQRFDALALRMAVTFDRPWDRAAIETARPQPRLVEIDRAEAHWGAMRLRLAGSFTVNTAGVPDGTLTLRAERWREMLAIAQDAGALPPSMVRGAERALNLLAGLGGDPDALDLQVNLREGFVALGPFPLGPAPRLILR